MTTQNQTRVTTKQNTYLLQLASGPKTTHDLVLSMMVTGASAAKMLKKLCNVGLVESAPQTGGRGRGRVYTHKLTRPYSELNIQVYNVTIGVPIPDEEIYYAAILRNGCMTGQRLKSQYHKVFPDRTYASIDNVVTKARERELCR